MRSRQGMATHGDMFVQRNGQYSAHVLLHAHRQVYIITAAPVSAVILPVYRNCTKHALPSPTPRAQPHPHLPCKLFPLPTSAMSGAYMHVRWDSVKAGW